MKENYKLFGMKLLYVLFLSSLLTVTGISMAANPWRMVRQIEKNIVAPEFPDRDYTITEYGALADGVTDSRPAIVKAIDRCSSEGGGRVVIPRGKFFCKGPVVLKSNVNFHLSEGAELIFSADERDYLPAVPTRWEGTEVFNYSPLVYAYNVKNIAITGKGTLNGQGSKNIATWKPRQKPDQKKLRAMGTNLVPLYEWVFGEGHLLRHAFVEQVSCTNVLIEGITLVDSPFWVIHPLSCENVTVRGVRVDSTNDNNDGCDPESCLNVLIEDCYFHTGDDGIAIKSGRDNDAWRIGQPTQNVIIRNCTFNSKINGLCIGSEISGGVRNVFAENLYIPNATDALYFKSNLDRGGYIENIHIRNVRADSVRSTLVKFEPDYKSESRNNYPTLFRGFLIENVRCGVAGISGIDISGFAQIPVENVTIRNLTLEQTPTSLIVKNAKNVTLQKVTINGVPQTVQQ